MQSLDQAALHDIAKELNETVQYLDGLFAVLSQTQRQVELLVYATRRLAAITAVDSMLRCPWEEMSKPVLVHELSKLCKVALAEAYDDVEVNVSSDA